jgi:flagellar biosynthesis anti-sigma factor FlgM
VNSFTLQEDDRMKIENNGMSPVSSRPTEAAKRTDKKLSHQEVQSVRAGEDRAEMSENARLLARARAALGSVQETGSEHLEALRNQIESGDYTVQVYELARKLSARFHPK